MTTKLQKWGNSQGLRIPKILLEKMGLDIGSEVNLTTDGRSITIRQCAPRRRRLRRIGKYIIDDLVANTPKNWRPAEVDLGKPVGNEVL